MIKDAKQFERDVAAMKAEQETGVEYDDSGKYNGVSTAAAQPLVLDPPRGSGGSLLSPALHVATPAPSTALSIVLATAQPPTPPAPIQAQLPVRPQSTAGALSTAQDPASAITQSTPTIVPPPTIIEQPPPTIQAPDPSAEEPASAETGGLASGFECTGFYGRLQAEVSEAEEE